MAYHKYTDKDKQFVIDNIKKLRHSGVASHFNIQVSALTTLLSVWRRTDKRIPKYSDIYKAKDGIKYCQHCEKDFPVSNFYCNNHSSDKLSTYCKDCHDASSKASKENYRLKKRVNNEGGLGGNNDNKRGGRRKYNKKEVIILDDNSSMPEGPYEGCRMMDVPAWYLLKIYNDNTCSQSVKVYVEDNIDFLKLENKN